MSKGSKYKVSAVYFPRLFSLLSGLSFLIPLTVNTPESKDLVLENCSECDVKYKLFYIANKEPPSRSRPASGKGT